MKEYKIVPKEIGQENLTKNQYELLRKIRIAQEEGHRTSTSRGGKRRRARFGK